MKAGWASKRFADVLEIRNGRNQRAVESSEGVFPILGSAGKVMGYATDYICEPGTTIIGRKGTIDTPVYIEERFWNVDTAFGLSPGAQLHPKFLNYFCQHYDFGAHNRGTTIPSLVKSDLLQIAIPVPPLEEQRRIAAVLDEAFAAIATATANAEKNLANARSLLERYLCELFTGSSSRVDEHLELQRGFDITKSAQRPGSVPVVSSGGIKSFHTNAMAVGPGVIIGRKGTLGSAFYVEGDYWPHDTTLWVKNFKGNNPKLVYYLFKSLDVKKLDTGSANPSLNRNLVHQMELKWPALSDQPELVTRLDKISLSIETLEGIYLNNLDLLSGLRRSLLQLAFAGDLIHAKVETIAA